MIINKNDLYVLFVISNKMLEDMMETVKDILGDYPGYRGINTKEFLKREYNPVLITSVQCCNMGGEYLRNFFIHNGEMYWFVSNLDFFENLNYDSVQFEKFWWKRTNRSTQ